MARAVVLHSGGLDSTVCLLLAREQHGDVASLGIDYGQRHRVELEYAARQAAQFGVERRVLIVSWDKPARDFPMGRTVEQMRDNVSPAFLPGRNAVFLALACAEAAGIGAGEVWIGVNARDYSGYPDCRPEFIAAFREMICLAIPGGPRIVAPLLERTKPQIASEAARFGLSSDSTWSCYRPQGIEGHYSPCGECDACVLHRYAWSAAAIDE